MQVWDELPPLPSNDRGARATDCVPFPWDEAARVATEHARRCVAPRWSHLAEDIAQDALIRLTRNLDRVQVNWPGYLCVIVQNTAKTHLRRELTRLRALPVAPDETSDPPDGQPGPAVQAFLNECHADLPALLGELDERFGRGTRAIVDLRSRGVPWAEIAEIVSLSERTCSTRINEATTWIARTCRNPTQAA
jgi:RNA polymerase sigma factor (sigma-70 family)